MKVADLELCECLYKLSMWPLDTIMAWYCDESRDDTPVCNYNNELELRAVGGAGYYTHKYPAYDLGYLLERLPGKLRIKNKEYGFVLTHATSDGCFVADYMVNDWLRLQLDRGGGSLGARQWLHHGDRAKLTEAFTAEDALCKLLIQLFEQKILTRDAS